MASRRMISMEMVSSDAFMDMPPAAQSLYFHLIISADDDGFVDSANKITRECQATKADLQILLDKRYLLGFPSGVVLIKHWFIHNTIPADRYKETRYTEEKSTVMLKCDKPYLQCNQKDNKAYTERNHVVDMLEHEDRLNKIKENKINYIVEQSTTGQPNSDEKTKPPYTEIIDYLNAATGKSFKDNTKATKRVIDGRFSDGFTLEDFKTVINCKAAQWKDNPNMVSYLRPETLFAASHFDSYLNEAPRRKEEMEKPPDDEEEGINLWDG